MDANSLSLFLQTIAPLGSVLNGVAPGLGTVATLGLEGGAALAAGQAKSKANQLLPPEQDPSLTNYLGEIDRRRRTFETGSAYSAQMRELKNQQSATQQGIIRAAGGNSGAAIAGLARTQEATGNAYGKIAEQGQALQQGYDQMYQKMLEDASQRTLGIKMLKYSQAQQDSRQNQANTSQNLMNLLSVMKPLDFKKLFGDGISLPQNPPQASALTPLGNPAGYGGNVAGTGTIQPTNLTPNPLWGLGAGQYNAPPIPY